MPREFAKKLYSSKAWKKLRQDYFKEAAGLCERCYKLGMIVPGEIVHHKEHVEVDNVSDAEVTLNKENLELLCRKCHAEVHDFYEKKKQRGRRYVINEMGEVINIE